MAEPCQFFPLLFQKLRGEPEFAVFRPDIDFQQDAGAFARLLRYRVQELRQAQGIHGMDQREMFQGLAHLVALEGADKVPFRVRRQAGIFSRAS